MISKVANNISFGHKVIIDMGASKRNNGSYKVSVLSDETGKELHQESGLVCPEGFRQNSDFLNGLVSRIEETYSKIAKNGILSPLSKKDKELTGMVIYSPGVAIGNKTDEIENLRLLETDASLKGIDYNQITAPLKAILKRMGTRTSNKFKLMATNDMIGAGASVVKKLIENPAFKDGYNALFLMAGGGLGVGQIEHLGDRVLIKTSECGHIGAYDTGKNLEQYGASSTALITNFAEESGLSPEDTKKLVNVGNAKIVSPNLVLEDEKEIKPLLDTGLFEVLSKDSEGTRLQLKGISPERRVIAVKSAVERFIEAISIIGSNKIYEGFNEIILTGPLTKGIQTMVNVESELFGQISFRDLVNEKISSLLYPAGESMKKHYKANLITDLEIPNNTVGGALALQGRFVGEEIRGNCLSVPTSVLGKLKRV